jgi:hypothetical protein
VLESKPLIGKIIAVSILEEEDIDKPSYTSPR